jgi:stage II sporulation protein AA (anti-sigma F factor antagonist)
MQLETTTLPSGIVQLSLTGRLDIAGVGQVENPFTFAVATREVRALVDLAGVEFIASIGIRMLLQNAKAVQARGGRMALYGPQPLVREALTTAGIDLLIPLFDDLDAACAHLLEAPAVEA